jgi:hypothetical protein
MPQTHISNIGLIATYGRGPCEVLSEGKGSSVLQTGSCCAEHPCCALALYTGCGVRRSASRVHTTFTHSDRVGSSESLRG